MTIEKDIYQDHKNYIDNGYKNRSEYLKHLSEYFMIPHASVCAIAEVLGTGEDFDYLLGIHCNAPIDDVDPAWYINPQFIGR